MPSSKDIQQEDLREKILIEEFEPVSESCRSVTEDLRIAIVLNPSLEKIKNAMDIYFEKRAKDLLQWMADNEVEIDSRSRIAEEIGEHLFWYKNEWITAEQLFENFL